MLAGFSHHTNFLLTDLHCGFNPQKVFLFLCSGLKAVPYPQAVTPIMGTQKHVCIQFYEVLGLWEHETHTSKKILLAVTMETSASITPSVRLSPEQTCVGGV